MKGKPIQAGCLALIVGVKNCLENNGRVVRVVRKVQPGEDPTPSAAYTEAHRSRLILAHPLGYDPHASRWLVEGVNAQLLWASPCRRVAVQVHVRSYQERYLMRIDDDSQDEPKALKAPRPKDEVI